MQDLQVIETLQGNPDSDSGCYVDIWKDNTKWANITKDMLERYTHIYANCDHTDVAHVH